MIRSSAVAVATRSGRTFTVTVCGGGTAVVVSHRYGVGGCGGRLGNRILDQRIAEACCRCPAVGIAWLSAGDNHIQGARRGRACADVRVTGRSCGCKGRCDCYCKRSCCSTTVDIGDKHRVRGGHCRLGNGIGNVCIRQSGGGRPEISIPRFTAACDSCELCVGARTGTNIIVISR